MTLIYSIPAVRDAWADAAIPTTDIVDPGNAFAAAGWLQSSTPPPRQYFNWALNWTANAVRYFMQNGIVDWQAGELYQAGAIVKYRTDPADDFVYQSQVNNNQGNVPPAAGTTNAFWGPLGGYATLANLAAYVTAAQLAVDLSAYAAINSPTLTGVPLAPTAAPGNSTNQISTTAFVQAALASNLSSYETIAAAAATYATLSYVNGNFVTTTALNTAIGGFGPGKLPAGTYRNSLGSGNVVIQQGGSASGGSPGDMTLIY